MFPFSLFLIYVAFRYINRWPNLVDIETINSLSSFKTLGLLFLFVLFFTLGAFLALSGVQNPLVLHRGVKGPAHGYTEAAVGSLIAIYSACGFHVLLKVKVFHN